MIILQYHEIFFLQKVYNLYTVAKYIMSYVTLGMKIVTKSVWCWYNSEIQYTSYVMLRMKIVTKSIWC